ncbi:MAG: hypothetical protein Q9199_005986 [Rusavskia elegans]
MDSQLKSDPITDVNGDTSSRDTSSSQAHHPVAEKGFGAHDQNLDQAYWYVQNSNNAVEATPAELRQLRRKIDWWIVPIMFACYTMQFIDKVSLNYAAVMGLNKELKLKSNEFSNAATWFFIAYLIAEVPNARIFLGIFEAAIAPCLILISGQWYTKSEQAPRFCIWYAGLGVGQIIGGIVSYGFQQVKNPTFSGWKIMFIVLGVVTVIIGFVTFFFLPDTPMKARFLSEPEKVMLLKHVSVNQTGIRNKHYKLSQALEILRDIQLWLMVLLTILISISSGVITTYSATLIRNFGYKPPTAALLNMPSGIVSIASTFIVGFGIRHTSHRWAWLVACCIPGILGGALMSFATGTKAGQLAGIYLVNSITATLIVIYQWTGSNVGGQTKRVISVALVSGSFSVGNIIGPQTFQAKDAPQFIPAKITVLATQAAAALIAVVLFVYYVWANKRKGATPAVEENIGMPGHDEERMWEDRTDKQNPTFRYVY